MPFTNYQGRDSALRCPRRQTQRQAAEKAGFYHIRSVLPDGDAASIVAKAMTGQGAASLPP
ncbi:MAG: hypothetical protein ABR955_07570 [Verrucomicrobiota bacterium]|jgi:hypothetical protein